MVSKLDKAALSGLYQLRVTSTATGNTTNGVLAIENGKYVVKASNYNLLNSLWCITITEQGQGKEPIYDFVNKATGEFLAINEADVQGLAVNATSGALQVGETYGGWGDYYVKSIYYVRCGSITLGYKVPISQKIAKNLRVYVDVNNPFVITNWTGLDPETDNGTYAYPRISICILYFIIAGKLLLVKAYDNVV